jgi:hypothetical protein
LATNAIFRTQLFLPLRVVVAARSISLQRLHPFPTTCSAQHMLPPHQHLLMRGAPLPPLLPQGSQLLLICLLTYLEQRPRMLQPHQIILLFQPIWCGCSIRFQVMRLVILRFVIFCERFLNQFPGMNLGGFRYGAGFLQHQQSQPDLASQTPADDLASQTPADVCARVRTPPALLLNWISPHSEPHFDHWIVNLSPRCCPSL